LPFKNKTKVDQHAKKMVPSVVRPGQTHEAQVSADAAGYHTIWPDKSGRFAHGLR